MTLRLYDDDPALLEFTVRIVVVRLENAREEASLRLATALGNGSATLAALGTVHGDRPGSTFSG